MLAAIRCLNEAGYEVTATAGSRLAPGLWSRACSSRQIIPGAALSAEDFTNRLVELASFRSTRRAAPGHRPDAVSRLP